MIFERNTDKIKAQNIVGPKWIDFEGEVGNTTMWIVFGVEIIIIFLVIFAIGKLLF